MSERTLYSTAYKVNTHVPLNLFPLGEHYYIFQYNISAELLDHVYLVIPFPDSAQPKRDSNIVTRSLPCLVCGAIVVPMVFSLEALSHFPCLYLYVC